MSRLDLSASSISWYLRTNDAVLRVDVALWLRIWCQIAPYSTAGTPPVSGRLFPPLPRASDMDCHHNAQCSACGAFGQYQPWQTYVAAAAGPVSAWQLTGAKPTFSFAATRHRGRGPLARITRHPVLWAIVVWARSHVPANGNLVSVIMFGGLGSLALGSCWLVDHRSRVRLGQNRWQALAKVTSIVPFAAILRGRTRLRWSGTMTLSAAVAVAIFVWFGLQGHRLIAGSDQLTYLGWR